MKAKRFELSGPRFKQEQDLHKDCSQCRSALTPYESHVWIAALMLTTSAAENSNSFICSDSAGLQSTRSDMVFSEFNSFYGLHGDSEVLPAS